MKKYLFVILSLVAVSAMAQDVWTEGTTWEISYTKEDHPVLTTYELTSSVEIDGTSYYPLTTTTDGVRNIVAYIRSERGDSLVYSRVVGSGGYLYPDMLLFDFTKSFEYGDSFRYGTEFGIDQMYISNDYPIEYIHNVIKEGDSLPIWNDIIYKLGPTQGPLGLFFEDVSSTGNNPKPKTTNVSHILFGTRKGAHAEIDFDPATGIIRRITFIDKDKHIYDLQGRRLYSIPEKGFYILNGKRYIK